MHLEWFLPKRSYTEKCFYKQSVNSNENFLTSEIFWQTYKIGGKEHHRICISPLFNVRGDLGEIKQKNKRIKIMKVKLENKRGDRPGIHSFVTNVR